MLSLCLILKLPHQFQDKDDEIANKQRTSIKSRHYRVNRAHMIVVESLVANLKIHDTLNIMDQITQLLLSIKKLVSLGSRSMEAEVVHGLMTKLPKSFLPFCDTISLIPNALDMNSFVGMLQDRATTKKSAQTSNETLDHAKSKGKGKHNGNSYNPIETNKQPNLHGAHL